MGLLRPATGLPNQVLLVAMQTAVEVSRQRPQYYATVARAFYELGSSGAYLVGSGAGPEASIAHALKKHLIGGRSPTHPPACQCACHHRVYYRLSALRRTILALPHCPPLLRLCFCMRISAAV